MNWQSPAIPPTIRKPWQVFQEDLEDKMLDCESEGVEVGAETRERVAMMQARGPFATFAELAAETQQTYVEVSLCELAAYVNWRSKQATIPGTTKEFEAGWDLLDCDAKADWIVEDPKALLAEVDPAWMPLLCTAAGSCPADAMGAAPHPLPLQAKVEMQDDAAAPAPSNIVKEESAAVAIVPKPQAIAVKQEPTSTTKVGNAAVSAVSATTDPPQKDQHASPPTHRRLRRGGDSVVAASPAPQQQILRSSAASRTTVQSNGQKISTTDGRRRELTSRKRVVARKRRKGEATESEDAAEDDYEASAESAEEFEPALKTPARKVLTSRQQASASDNSRDTAQLRRNASAQPLATASRGRKRKPAPENLCPEAMDAVCCVCNKADFSAENDLGLCDKCDRGFHARCHDPPLADFGSVKDQWFCSDCIKDIAEERGLRAKVSDFVWASLSPGTQPWPARVVVIDFTSLADPKPYWVQYFDSGLLEGSWVGDSQLLPWSEGPSFSSIRDSRRRVAVRLAEGDGAPPISGDLTPAPVKPLPRTHAVQPPPKAPRNAAVNPVKPAAEPEQRTKRLSVKSPPHRRRRVEEDLEESELQSQVDEMKTLVQQAQERQARMEKELDEEMQIASQRDSVQNDSITQYSQDMVTQATAASRNN